MSKKRVSGAWVDDTPHIYNTSTDTFSTLPHEVIGDGTAISAWSMKGNMTQSGTPTPSNPIYPTECGDKTANLFNGTYTKGFVGTTYIYRNTGTNANCAIIPCNPSTTYTVKKFDESNRFAIGTSSVQPYDEIQLTGIYYQDTATSYTFTTDSSAHYMVVYVSIGTEQAEPRLMVNEGQPMDYQPYGYKIPISSGSTTTPVYLGQVQSTRQIKKLVLTGEEAGWFETTGNAPFLLSLDNMLETASSTTLNWLSNQYVAVTPSSSWSSYDYCITSTANRQYLRFRDVRYSTIADFKTYLAQQYSAGTPVTIWYVLETPTTGIVNEPIRKIGTYADTVTNPVTIPTSGTAQTFDVSTTLKPSEVSLTWHGWHEHSDTKYTTP